MTELFLKTLNQSISAGWLVLVVLLLRLVFKRAPKWVSVLLWGIVALRLVCPFSIESALSLIPSAQTVNPEIMLSRNPSISTGVLVVDDVINPMILYSFEPEPTASANPLQILIPVAAQLWGLGIAVLLAYTAVSYWQVCRRVRTAVLLRGNIFQSEQVVSPFVLGIIKPRIYLPFTLSEESMKYVVAHEKAHIARRDHWWKPLGFALLTIHWFNPMMWIAYHLFCRDMELACDETVIRRLDNDRRAAYAGALLACSVKRSAVAACPIAFGEVGVKTRIRSVLHYRKPAFWLLVIALILCAVVSVCFLTDPIQQQEPAETPTVPSESRTEQTDPEETVSGALEESSDLAYFVELAKSDKIFRDMDADKQKEILGEYGDLLDGHTLLARESEDGSLFYIVGYFGGPAEENPFNGMAVQYTDLAAGAVQLLYREEDSEVVEQALAAGNIPDAGYAIQDSFIHCSSRSGYILIHPMDAGWELSDVYNRYVAPNGRAYMLDAASRGIALCTPEGPYLEVGVFSEQWGEVFEKIPLTEEQALEILAEDRVKLEEGYGFSAGLYNGTASNLELDWDEGQFTAFLGVPQTVLDLAVEKCGYKFAAPRDITGTITQARLDCSWLDEPRYASESDLERLQGILTHAEYDYVGKCGYGARLTIQMSDGSTMVLFKGTDSCGSLIFGSYGGYTVGEQEDLAFWEIFGLGDGQHRTAE